LLLDEEKYKMTQGPKLLINTREVGNSLNCRCNCCNKLLQ